jgi:acyl carrier protein
MDEIKLRLAKCFQTVFPELVTEEDVYNASQETLAAWDSIAVITLVNVIEEEFQIQMDFEALETLTTFDRVLEHLAQAHQ